MDPSAKDMLALEGHFNKNDPDLALDTTVIQSYNSFTS